MGPGTHLNAQPSRDVAIRDCIGELERTELRGLVYDVLTRQAKPLLGICVGQQMLMERSEENGGVDCLGFFQGSVDRFPANMRDAQEQRLKVPHMGWNLVNQHHDHPLWAGIDNHEHFYFVHSYYVNAADDATGGQSFGHMLVATAVFTKAMNNQGYGSG